MGGGGGRERPATAADRVDGSHACTWAPWLKRVVPIAQHALAHWPDWLLLCWLSLRACVSAQILGTYVARYVMNDNTPALSANSMRLPQCKQVRA